MGDQDPPGQHSRDGLLAEAEHEAQPAARKVGDIVRFVRYPELIGREGIIIRVTPRSDFPYTVELAGGDIVTCREDDLAPAS